MEILIIPAIFSLAILFVVCLEYSARLACFVVDKIDDFFFWLRHGSIKGKGIAEYNRASCKLFLNEYNKPNRFNPSTEGE